MNLLLERPVSTTEGDEVDDLIARRFDNIDRSLRSLDGKVAEVDREVKNVQSRIKDVEEEQDLAKGRAGVLDRALFGGPDEDGNRVVSLFERLENVEENASIAATGTAELKTTWEQFPQTVLKYGMRSLWGAGIVLATIIGFIFANWDKIARTIELWRH